MRLEWDFSEFETFADRLMTYSMFEKFCEQATKQLADLLHRKLKEKTPRVTGELVRGWDNAAYVVKHKGNTFEIELTNDVEYALSVNDGHYSYNQFNVGGTPYIVKDDHRTVAYYDGVKNERFVYGHFFVEKSILEVNEHDSELRKIIFTQMKKWFRWCVNGK